MKIWKKTHPLWWRKTSLPISILHKLNWSLIHHVNWVRRILLTDVKSVRSACKSFKSVESAVILRHPSVKFNMEIMHNRLLYNVLTVCELQNEITAQICYESVANLEKIDLNIFFKWNFTEVSSFVQFTVD